MAWFVLSEILPSSRSFHFGHVFADVDLGILRRLLRDEVHEALAADAHEARVILHHGRDRDLAAEVALLDYDGIEARAHRIDRGRKPRGPAPDDDQVLQYGLSRDLGGCHLRLLEREQRLHEPRLGLEAGAGEGIVHERLRNGERAEAFREVLVLVDLDRLGGHEVGFYDRRRERGKDLLRTVGTRGADEHLDVPFLAKVFGYFLDGRVRQKGLARGRHHQGHQE